MPLDLERVCISLRGAMQGGFAKCPGYKPSGTFGKLFRVCKVVTNNGALTCSTGADCTGEDTPTLQNACLPTGGQGQGLQWMPVERVGL